MTKVTRSSGNVFRDLGFGQEEAEHLRLRSALMAVVRQLMGDLVRGKIERFSIDGLIEMLGRAGVHVEMRIAPARTRKTARVA